jgi:hypothetical protein
MSHLALRRLIGAALVDRDLSHGLMNGKRSALMAEFDLTDQERQVVGALESESVWELASTVHVWLKKQRGPISSPVDCSALQVP